MRTSAQSKTPGDTQLSVYLLGKTDKYSLRPPVIRSFSSGNEKRRPVRRIQSIHRRLPQARR
uniref:Uncharacterized protein n=1 Tax=mine drainage metagenome TaxID=410659 RepID=E6QMT2_9ZZZZ